MTISKRQIGITETIIRDAQQSMIATRMEMEEMLPILDTLDEVGYHSIEGWGGATFDACLRFLKEDPWERLRTLKKHFKKTKLQMLFRGQNILGYRHYSDRTVQDFIRKSIANGIDIIRIFDALNDLRNLEFSIKSAKAEGAIVEVAISFTLSPVHNLDHFVDLAKGIQNLGADSICIKDMSGLLSPYYAFELFKKLRAETCVQLTMHSHYTTGFAAMTYLKAIEGGCDIIDCSLSPLSMGTSQPATETLFSTFLESPYTCNLNVSKLSEASRYFEGLRQKYIKIGKLDTQLLRVDSDALNYQVPGGMLSNLLSQLKLQSKEHLFEEVLKEVPNVRKDMGYIPLVTPTSQIVGTQAVLNVMTGQRYKMVTTEIKDIVRGAYGITPVPISEEIIKLILRNGEEIITVRPADLIADELEVKKQEIAEYIEQEEDILSYALFGNVALEYFKHRQSLKYKIDSNFLDSENMTYPV